MRQQGYYWVKIQGYNTNPVWDIGEWENNEWTLGGRSTSYSDTDFLEIDERPITRPTRTLMADELTREQATELIKVITQDVDHARIQVLEISTRRIKYLNGAQFEGEPIEQVLRFDALHPKQFKLLMEWWYDF